MQLNYLGLLTLIFTTGSATDTKNGPPVLGGKCYDPLQQRYLNVGDALKKTIEDCSETVCAGTVIDAHSRQMVSMLDHHYCEEMDEKPPCPPDKTAPYPQCCPGGPCVNESSSTRPVGSIPYYNASSRPGRNEFLIFSGEPEVNPRFRPAATSRSSAQMESERQEQFFSARNKFLKMNCWREDLLDTEPEVNPRFRPAAASPSSAQMESERRE